MQKITSNAMEKEAAIEKVKELEFYSFGTTRIFERRARLLRRGRTWITFLGLITPLIAGAIVLSFGVELKLWPEIIFIAGVIGLIQIILSAWAIVARWDEMYEYAIDSLKDNTSIYNKCRHFKELQSENYELVIDEIVKAYEMREAKDLTQGITEKENRRATRESLKYFKKPCDICEEIPKTSKPSKCDRCGNF